MKPTALVGAPFDADRQRTRRTAVADAKVGYALVVDVGLCAQLPAKVVAALMWHSNPNVTLNVYTQVLDDSMRSAVERIGTELFTIVHSPDGTSELSRLKNWLTSLDNFRNWLIRSA